MLSEDRIKKLYDKEQQQLNRLKELQHNAFNNFDFTAAKQLNEDVDFVKGKIHVLRQVLELDKIDPIA